MSADHSSSAATAVEVDAKPSECERFGATHSGDHNEPDKGAPVVVLVPGSGDDPCRVGWTRRVGRRLPGHVGDVASDPVPPHCSGEGGANGEVNFADRRLCHRSAHVLRALRYGALGFGAVVIEVAAVGWSAWRVSMAHRATLVLAVGAVLDKWATITQSSAST
jgi:hypothetical protein